MGSCWQLLRSQEFPGWTYVPLEVLDEDLLEVRPVADAVVREEFEPRSNMFPHVDGEVLNDEVVIVHSSGSAGKLEVFETYAGIHVPGVFGDVGRWLEALWERRSLDATAKSLWSRAIRAGTLVGDHACGASPRSPRWFGQGPCRLLLPPHDGRHHHARPDVDCR